MKCLTPECENNAVIRGLCKNCYGVASRIIKSGDVSWAQLVTLGFAYEVKPTLRRKTSLFAKALVNAIEQHSREEQQNAMEKKHEMFESTL
jgi:hypothetical protein